MVRLMVCVSTTSSNRLSYLELLGIWYGCGFYNVRKTSNVWMERFGSEEVKERDASVQVNRRLIRTVGGYIGLAASGAPKGDRIALVRCRRVPLVLRQNSKSDTSDWNFVRDTYIHGIIYRAAFDTSRCGNMSLS